MAEGKKHWIQKAVNPKHRGFCTPMTKSTCTPKRKALAMTFKKHHGFHENGGVQGQQDQQGNMNGNAASMIGSGAGMLSGYVGQFTEGSDTGNVAGSAMKGISAGAALGPWGMAGGAVLGTVSGLMSNKAKHKAENEAELAAMRQRTAVRNQNFLATQPQQQSYQPTFKCGGKVYSRGGLMQGTGSNINYSIKYPVGGTTSTTKYNPEEDVPTSTFYNKTLPEVMPRLKDKAELYYYAQQLNQNLRGKNPQGYDELNKNYGWNPQHPLSPKTRVTGADNYVEQGKFTGSLTPEESQKILGNKWDRYNELKNKYGKELNLYGENEEGKNPSNLNIGARHAVAFNPSAYTYKYKPDTSDEYTNKFEYEMKYDPTNTDNPYITTKEERYKYDPSTKGYIQYAQGGMINSNAELEQGEPYRTPDGQIHQISDNAPTHAQGGVQMDLPNGTEILGKMIDPVMDEEFKEIGQQLKKAQDKYTKIIDSKPTPLAKKTAGMMLQKVQNKYDELMHRQEALKDRQVQQQQEYAYGGYLGGIPTQYAPKTFLPKYDEPNSSNGYSMTVGTPLKGQGAYSWNVQDPLYTANAQPTYMMNQNTQSASQPNTIPFNPATDTFTNLSNKSDSTINKWDKVGNAVETAGTYAPTAYNLAQGIFGKANTLSQSNYQNEYNSQIRSLMSGRKYNVDPELEANRLSMATYLQNLRKGAPSQGRYLAGVQAGMISKQRADAESYAKKQNVENQYKGEEAQMLSNMGDKAAATRLNIEDINARRKAAQRNYLPTALSQLQQASFVNKQTKMQKLRDKQKLEIYKEMYKNYPFDLTKLYEE